VSGALHSPLYLAVDGKGRLYVSQLGPAVKVFDGDGNFIDSFGGNEAAFGIAINDANEIFACFPFDPTVRKFALVKP
jgi:hypothetical protein